MMKHLNKAIQLIQNAAAEKENLIIGIAGGSCSGKTTAAREIEKRFNAAVLKMDDYYKDTGPIAQEKFGHNFDEPAALDMKLLASHLAALKKGRAVRKPVYDFRTHSRAGHETFSPRGVIVVDGIFALHPPVRKHLDIKLFVQCPEKRRLERRIARDAAERGRTRQSVLHQFHTTVKPMHDRHVEPARDHADIVISN